MQQDLQSVLKSLRAKESLDPDTCANVLIGHGPSGAVGTPLHHLRAQVTDDDLDSIVHALHQAPENRDEPFRVAIHLLQGLLIKSNEPTIKARVRGILEGAWLAARGEQGRGRAVAASLTSIDELADETHEDIFRFLVDNWEAGRHYTETLMGGADKIVPWVNSRLQDDRWPESKAWVYVLMLGYSNQSDEVKRIIKGLPEGIDERTKRAADFVLKALRTGFKS